MAEGLTKRYGSAKKARQSLKGGGGSGVLRRIKADETVKVRFLQEPEDWEEAYYHWIGDKFVWCNRSRNCMGCKAGDRAKKTVLANAVELAAGKVVIMQMPPSLADQVLKRHEKYETVMDRDYDLSREGSGLSDTRYSVDYDMPKKRNLDRYDLHDIPEQILAELGDDEEEEDAPRSTKKPVKKSSRRDDDDEYEDDEDEDEEEQNDFSDLDRNELKREIKKLDPDFVAKKSQTDDDLRAYLWDLNYAEDSVEENDDDEEEDERPRKPSRAVAKKKPARRSSHEDEDDEEDEAPARSTKKSRGLNEFKKETTSNPRVRTVRRAAR